MPRIIRDDGARLEYQIVEPTVDDRSRLPFLFQHGMGGDRRQPIGYVQRLERSRLIAMDARGHGDSSDIVGTGRASFDAFGDDLIELADHLELDRFIVGGISLGAGTALNVALRYPERVAGLVLCRPAWLDHAQAARNSTIYALIADLLDDFEVPEALSRLQEDQAYLDVAAESASAAASLRLQVTRPRAAVNSTVLRRFPTDSPSTSAEEWADILVPTVVIAHHDDPFHPWSIAEQYADAILGASLIEVPSKDRDPDQFARRVRTAISEFIDRVGAETVHDRA